MSNSIKLKISPPAMYFSVIPVYMTSDLLYISALAGNQPHVLPQ